MPDRRGDHRPRLLDEEMIGVEDRPPTGGEDPRDAMPAVDLRHVEGSVDRSIDLAAGLRP
jgi:hypothetical protein